MKKTILIFAILFIIALCSVGAVLATNTSQKESQIDNYQNIDFMQNCDNDCPILDSTQDGATSCPMMDYSITDSNLDYSSGCPMTDSTQDSATNCPMMDYSTTDSDLNYNSSCPMMNYFMTDSIQD